MILRAVRSYQVGDLGTVAPVAAGMSAIITWCGYLLYALSRMASDNRLNVKFHYEALKEAESRSEVLQKRVIGLLADLEASSVRTRNAVEECASIARIVDILKAENASLRGNRDTATD